MQVLLDQSYSVTNAITTNTDHEFDVSRAQCFSIQAIIDVNTPGAQTVDSGTLEIQTLTYDTKANSGHQDFVIVENQAGLSFAVALTKPVAEVQTVTFPDFATIVDRDYVVVEDTAGVKYAVYADKTGTSIAPTGAAYVAATHKVKADISGATTVTDVTDAFETAFNTLTGFTAAITTSGTVTLILTQVIKAPVVDPAVHNLDDSGAGTILGVQTTAGVASVAPSGPLWTAIASARKGLADISGDTTAAQVAARAETAWNLLTGFTSSITSNDTAADGTMTFTQTVFGPTTNPVPKNAAESGAGSILGVQTTAGNVSEIDYGTANSLSIPSHGFTTGLKVDATTTGTLPTGLSPGAYFVIALSDSLVSLASSLANALAGTAVNITGEGVGVHTLTPTALAGGFIKLEKSNNGTTWDEDIANAAITADADVWLEVAPAHATMKYVRPRITMTAGSMNVTYQVLIKSA